MTAQVAIDAMFAQFNAAWQAGTAAVVGYVPEIRWQGREKETPPPGDKYWARVSNQTVGEGNAAIGNSLFESYGLVFVQVFAPKSEADANEKGRALAVLARNVFRAQNPLVCFRHARVQELEPEAAFIRFNAVTEYEFYELKG